MKPFIVPLLLLMGLVFLAFSCFWPSSKLRKDVVGGAWRKTDFPALGFILALLMAGIFGSQLAREMARGGSSSMLVFGCTLLAVAYGVYIGRTIERGAQDGRPGPEATTEGANAGDRG